MDTDNDSLFNAQLAINACKLPNTSNTIALLNLSQTRFSEQTTTDNAVGQFTDNDEISHESNNASSNDRGSSQQEINTFLHEASMCRTTDGSVDQGRMELLVNQFEVIGNTERALIKFTKAALDGSEIKLVKNTGGGARGRSGATIYFVQDTSDATVAVCKKFPKQEELIRELSSVSRLQTQEFTHFTVPAPLAVAKIKINNQYIGVLISEVAKGQSIADFIDSMQNILKINGGTKMLDELNKAVIKIAYAFAQLHRQPHGSGDLASNSYLTMSIDRARHLISVLANEYTTHQEIILLNIHEVRFQLDQLIRKCLKEKSCSAIVHGDAHPGNLFCDSSAGVTFIDTSSLHFSMDSFGNPIGTPEQDIASFVGRFTALCRKSGICESDIDLCRVTFRKEYRKYNTASLSENKLKFFELRLLLGELVQACNNKCSKDIKTTIASLKQVLGWTT